MTTVLIPSSSGRLFECSGRRPFGARRVLIPSSSGRLFELTPYGRAIIVAPVLIPSSSGRLFEYTPLSEIDGMYGLNPFFFRAVV